MVWLRLCRQIFSNNFVVHVELNQGSVLSLLLFIIALEVISLEISYGFQGKLAHTHDLVLVSKTLKGLKERLETWKRASESKWLRVNIKRKMEMLQRKTIFLFLCRKGVDSNSILCQFCRCWVHKRCSGIIGKLKVDSKLTCQTCTSQPMDIAEGYPGI